jgi:hypothetical protein
MNIEDMSRLLRNVEKVGCRKCLGSSQATRQTRLSPNHIGTTRLTTSLIQRPMAQPKSAFWIYVECSSKHVVTFSDGRSAICNVVSDFNKHGGHKAADALYLRRGNCAFSGLFAQVENALLNASLFKNRSKFPSNPARGSLLS